MARERKGTTVERDGKIYARITYIGSDGKRHAVWRRAENKTHARELKKKLLREFEDHGESSIDGDHLVFRELASIYEDRKLIPAEYVGDRKVAGLRSVKPPQTFLKVLIDFFGPRRIKSITHSDVEKFRRERLKTKTVRDEERTIASVNRELELLRAILNFAKREGWLIKTPFETGSNLISKADETRRERVLSRDEEERLLMACTGRRAHLKVLLMAALDTACRRGELLQMKWSDVDFENRLINVRALTTKTARSRNVPISARLLEELKSLYNKSKNDEELVFGIKTDVKHSFASACKDSDVEDFHFHDCRHTGITRMIKAGMPPTLVMKISGHTQMDTFIRYVNTDNEAINQAIAAIDSFHTKKEAIDATEASETIN
jgi:integrase